MGLLNSDSIILEQHYILLLYHLKSVNSIFTKINFAWFAILNINTY